MNSLYCEWCQEEGHTLEQCWCTRPVGWQPIKVKYQVKDFNPWTYLFNYKKEGKDD